MSEERHYPVREVQSYENLLAERPDGPTAETSTVVMEPYTEVPEPNGEAAESNGEV